MSAPSERDLSAVHDRAREWLGRQMAGDYDPRQLSEHFPYSPESAERGAELLAFLGAPEAMALVDAHTSALGITRYRYRVTFASAVVLFEFGVFESGKINQLSIKPFPGERNPFEHLIPKSG